MRNAYFLLILQIFSEYLLRLRFALCAFIPNLTTQSLHDRQFQVSELLLDSRVKQGFTFSAEVGHQELQHYGKVVYLEIYDFMAISTPKDVGKSEAALDYMFLDEGHHVKHPATKTAKNLARLHCLHRIIITVPRHCKIIFRKYGDYFTSVFLGYLVPRMSFSTNMAASIA